MSPSTAVLGRPCQVGFRWYYPDSGYNTLKHFTLQSGQTADDAVGPYPTHTVSPVTRGDETPPNPHAKPLKARLETHTAGQAADDAVGLCLAHTGAAPPVEVAPPYPKTRALGPTPWPSQIGPFISVVIDNCSQKPFCFPIFRRDLWAKVPAAPVLLRALG